MLSPDKREALERRMALLGVFEDDLIEKFIRGTGSGGQKINKTSSCVFLQHPPTGIEIKVQRDRSREINRFLAREELCRRLEEKSQNESLAHQNAREKKRRRHRRPGVRARARNVEKKRRHGQKKQNRRRPGLQD
ncbi:MAG: peptide chain release factor-like protein [Akkermansiaceae bacterium]|jgi:protein subunit release factor B